MKLILFCTFFISVFNSVTAQDKYEIGFGKDTTIYRNLKIEELYIIEINSNTTVKDEFKEYVIQIEADKKSTFPKSEYYLDKSSTQIIGKKLKDLSKTNLFGIIIKPSDQNFIQAKPLELYLNLLVKKVIKDSEGKDSMVNVSDTNNAGKIQVRITVMPSDRPLTTYKYLGYLGTNFDLVDGVKPKNLFFATNIFVPETNKWGFSLSLYGNRTMTKTDTSKQTRFESQIVKLNDDSIARYYDTAIKVTTRVSDNIGISFSPLFPINHDGDITLYYAPQFEFIWRRTTLENSYTNPRNVEIDSMKSRLAANTVFPLITPLSTKVDFNVYDAYLGLAGLLLKLENDDISIRISSSVGINFNYTPIGGLSNEPASSNPLIVYPTYNKQTRFFYFGRFWITEPNTGLTLGGEVSNYFGKRKDGGNKISNAQPYYNVTLSKAFTLKSFAGLVKPLTSR